MPRREARGTAVDVHIGSRVRLRRTLLGMSQKTLALAIGLSSQQIQKYESGANQISAGRLQEISPLLGVAVSYFFEDMPGAPALPATGPDDNVMVRRETLELVRTYYRITDPRLRQILADVVRALAKALDR